MPSNKIEIEMAIDDLRAQMPLKKLQKELAKLQGQMAKLNGEGAQSGLIADKVAKRIYDAAASFLGIGSAVAALSKAADLMQSEIAEIQRHQSATTDKQANYANVIRGALRNVGTDSETGQANISGPELQVLAEVRADEAGVSPTAYTEALSGSLAGVSPGSREDVNKAADIASAVLKIWGDLPLAEMKITAGSIADFMKKNKVNAETAAGAVLNMGALHRTADTQPLSVYALPGAVRTTAVGGSIQEGIGGVAYMSQRMIDPNGEKSGTVWPKFVQELTDALPDKKNLQERLEFAAKTPEFQKVFFEGGEFGDRKFDKPNLGHGEAIPFLKTLLNDPEQMATYKEYVRNSGDAAKWTTVFANSLKELNSTGAIAVAKAKQASEGAVEGMALTQDGMAGVSREQLKNLLAQSGMGNIDQVLSGVQFEVNTGFGEIAALNEAIRQLEARIEDLRSPRIQGMTMLGRPTEMRAPELATPEGLDVANKLEGAVRNLRKQGEDYESRVEMERTIRRDMEADSSSKQPVRSERIETQVKQPGRPQQERANDLRTNRQSATQATLSESVTTDATQARWTPEELGRPQQERANDLQERITTDRNITESDVRIYNHRISETQQEAKAIKDPTTARLLDQQLRLMRELLDTAKQQNTLVAKQNQQLSALQTKPVQQTQPAAPQPKKRAESVVAKMQTGIVGVK
jgi:hypothetical protein